MSDVFIICRSIYASVAGCLFVCWCSFICVPDDTFSLPEEVAVQTKSKCFFCDHKHIEGGWAVIRSGQSENNPCDLSASSILYEKTICKDSLLTVNERFEFKLHYESAQFRRGEKQKRCIIHVSCIIVETRVSPSARCAVSYAGKCLMFALTTYLWLV